MRLAATLAVLALAAAACGSKNADPVPSPPRPAAPAVDAPTGGFVTIPFTATAECPGGEWFVDGEAQGSYPVTKHSVRTGQHTIEIESGFGHCAGYGTLTVEIRAGKEHVLPPEDFRR